MQNWQVNSVSKKLLKVSVVALALSTLLSGCSSSDKQPKETQATIKTAEKQENQDASDAKKVSAKPSSQAATEQFILAEASHHSPNTSVPAKSIPRNRAGKLSSAVVTGSMLMPDTTRPASITENYQHYPENGVWTVAEQPLSTFSIDVDTAGYANIRRMLNQGMTPPEDAVRIEEMINYFDYQYPQPQGELPFYVDTSVAKSPTDKNKHIMRVALSGKQVSHADRTPANLVFLLDVSGSMSADNKLPLLKRALSMLVQQLDARDSVAIVVYAGASGVVLEPTSGDNKLDIVQALDKLQAGGSTNGASGIQLAYQMAQKAFKKDGVNRVLLATDGDFNVGTTDHNALMELIEKQRETGINLSVLGFGNGNYNDHLTEQLADKGNGNAAYIDNINEARKVLVEQLTGTLQVIAKDVKIQVEFNPSVVHEYRLIGYENRILNKEDFNNDKVDAGEIGAGHKVTALYEVTLKNAEQYAIDELRYQPAVDENNNNDEIALVKLRYKAPQGEFSTKIERVVFLQQIQEFADTDSAFKFAFSVAGLGQLLKGSKFVSKQDADTLLSVARSAKSSDEQGYRAEFIRLMETWLLLDSPVVQSKKITG